MEINLTTNAFIFSWDENGIESIVPITQYEQWDIQNLIKILKDQPTERNPLNSIIQRLILRAKFNTQRHYEIYAIDCDTDLDEQFWVQQWNSEPQATADLIRDRGLKLYSNKRDTIKKPVIV